jgi:hypothetical protein
MKNKLFLAALTSTIAFGCATAAKVEMSEKAAARLAEFEPTGKTRSCMSLTTIRSIDALDESHFLVEAAGGDYYLNKVSGRCSGAGRAGNRLQYTVTTGQLCRNEIITVVDNSQGFTVGSCGLGDYEELQEKPAE